MKINYIIIGNQISPSDAYFVEYKLQVLQSVFCSFINGANLPKRCLETKHSYIKLRGIYNRLKKF